MIPTTLLPEQYRSQWCVAGGFAACPARAEDIDVWVYGIPTDDLDIVRDAILAHLTSNQLVAGVRKYRTRQYVFQSEEAESTQPSYLNTFIQIKKVAVLYGRRDWRLLKPIHVMVTDAPSPGELVAGFDISTHSVAVDYNGRVWTNGYTHPGEQPRLLSAANENTPKRMQKICERFGHPYTPTEVPVGEI